MVTFIDQPQNRLVAGSSFLLKAMRAWSAFAEQHRCPLVSLAPSFSRFGLHDALDPLHAIMLAVHRDGRYRLAFGALHDDRVTEGEALLLALWADVAGGNIVRVQAVMELLLAEAAIAPCIACMVRVTGLMTPLGLAPSGLEYSCPIAASERPRSADQPDRA